MPRMKSLTFPWARPAILLAGFALALPAGAQTIKRWVDERGMVHYGDAPPPSNARASAEIAPAPPLTAADKAAADERMRQYREVLAQPPVAVASAASAPQTARPALPQDDSCASQWARYNAAYACMDPYRMVDGRIRPEAFDKCPVVAQPSCPAP